MPDPTAASYAAEVRTALRQFHLDVDTVTYTPDNISLDLGVFDDHGRLALRWDRTEGWAWDLTGPTGATDTGELCLTALAPADQVAWAVQEALPHLYQLTAISRAVARLATALVPYRVHAQRPQHPASPELTSHA